MSRIFNQMMALSAAAFVASVSSWPETGPIRELEEPVRGGNYDEAAAAKYRSERAARKAANFAKRNGKG